MPKCLKKLFAIMVSLAILIACIPTVSVFAETLGGTCGENVTWSLDTESGVLTISGSGAMSNYDWSNEAPWYSQSNYIKSVNIENGVTSIGGYAFWYCSSLTSVTIPDSVTSIGEYAFYGCSSLTAINVGGGNQSYSSQDGVLFNKNKTELILCPGGKSGEYVIPNSVKNIRYDAFKGCNSLFSINVDSKNQAYSSQNGILFNKNKTELIRCPEGKSGEYVIPDSVTSIGDYAFYGCRSLTSITIPDSVTSIGSYAFNYTAYYNNEGNWTDGVLFIDNHLISTKYSLSGEYIIPAGTKTIASNAFSNCSSLTSVTIPDSVTSIGSSAFWRCSSLTSVTIPDSVTSIGYAAFRDCSSLESVTIGNSVTSIGWYAFECCTNLTSITIPKSVTSIGEDAFYNCNNLTIRCYKNSAAHNYAIENDISYIIIKDSVPAPNAPTIESKTNSSVTLIATDGYEYSIDGINWQTSNVFYNLESNTEYTFYQRVAETDTTYASESSTGTVVSTDKYIIGDANGDGRINNKDLGLLMQKLNGWTVEIDDAVADVNADGKVNNKDYGLLMQYINGWEVVIG